MLDDEFSLVFRREVGAECIASAFQLGTISPSRYAEEIKDMSEKRFTVDSLDQVTLFIHSNLTCIWMNFFL